MRNTVASTGAVRGIQTVGNGRIAHNVVSGLTSSDNASTGIMVGTGAVVEGNEVSNISGVAGTLVAAISTNNLATVRGNNVFSVTNSGSGDALGIRMNSRCIVEGNSCDGSRTGTTGTAVSAGISASGGEHLVFDNHCTNNDAGAGSNGSGIGITLTGSGHLVRNNHCASNSGAGTGVSCGIQVAGLSKVEGNSCQGNQGGAASHGIRATGTGNLVSDNYISTHTDGGMIFLVATRNRSERNRCEGNGEAIESTAPGVAPASIGTGDLADLSL